MRALSLVLAADSHPFIVPRVRRYLEHELGASEDDRKAWIRHWLSEGFRIAEERLSAEPATGRFCHGDSPTMADLCLVPHVTAARLFGVESQRYPTVDRIAAACLALDAFADALPMRQPGAPAPA